MPVNNLSNVAIISQPIISCIPLAVSVISLVTIYIDLCLRERNTMILTSGTVGLQNINFRNVKLNKSSSVKTRIKLAPLEISLEFLGNLSFRTGL